MLHYLKKMRVRAVEAPSCGCCNCGQLPAAATTAIIHIFFSVKVYKMLQTRSASPYVQLWRIWSPWKTTLKKYATAHNKQYGVVLLMATRWGYWCLFTTFHFIKVNGIVGISCFNIMWLGKIVMKCYTRVQCAVCTTFPHVVAIQCSIEELRLQKFLTNYGQTVSDTQKPTHSSGSSKQQNAKQQNSKLRKWTWPISVEPASSTEQILFYSASRFMNLLTKM